MSQAILGEISDNWPAFFISRWPRVFPYASCGNAELRREF